MGAPPGGMRNTGRRYIGLPGRFGGNACPVRCAIYAKRVPGVKRGNP